MLDKQGLDKYWQDRVQKSVQPCHYMNPVMDKYAWDTRTKAIDQCRDIISKSKRIFDIGCGDGRYTQYLTHYMPEVRHVVGVDRPEMIRLAATKYSESLFLKFLPGTVGDQDMKFAVQLVDLITMFTVYDFMTIDERVTLRNTLAKHCSPGTRLMILDLFPTTVPKYQMGLPYKEVETKDKKIHDWFNAGFDVERIVPVNYMDTKLFYKLGKNSVVRGLTKLCDKVLALFAEPKYSLVVFRKL